MKTSGNFRFNYSN